MSWQDDTYKNISTLDELEQNNVKIPENEREELEQVIKLHPIKITKYYLDLAVKNPALLKMCMPNIAKLTDTDGSYDASDEAANTVDVATQHKYKQTVLFLVTDKCFLNCRYCFRIKLTLNPEIANVSDVDTQTSNNINKLIKYVEKHKVIDNVIFSGGDSFCVSNKLIDRFLDKVTQIDHVRYIRFGTKAPVVFPQRITENPELLDILFKYQNRRKKIYVVTHFCHPAEITPEAIKAIQLLQQASVEVYNQAVLLKGVNDNARTLANLFNELIKINVLPYYLFQCRPVKRVQKQFQVPLARGFKIFEKAKSMVKGHILCKRIKFVMSHTDGKIEVISISEKNNQMVFKFHQPKDRMKDSTRTIILPFDKKTTWIDL